MACTECTFVNAAFKDEQLNVAVFVLCTSSHSCYYKRDAKVISSVITTQRSEGMIKQKLLQVSKVSAIILFDEKHVVARRIPFISSGETSGAALCPLLSFASYVTHHSVCIVKLLQPILPQRHIFHKGAVAPVLKTFSFFFRSAWFAYSMSIQLH